LAAELIIVSKRQQVTVLDIDPNTELRTVLNVKSTASIDTISTVDADLAAIVDIITTKELVAKLVINTAAIVAVATTAAATTVAGTTAAITTVAAAATTAVITTAAITTVAAAAATTVAAAIVVAATAAVATTVAAAITTTTSVSCLAIADDSRHGTRSTANSNMLASGLSPSTTN
jgi:hypothetical protein